MESTTPAKKSTISPEAPTTAKEDAPRAIVLCFDGTGNKFGENSNVVRLFKALVKDQPDRQIVYYQPGVGTYNQRQFLTRSVSSLASAIDKGVALHLNDHVKEGYQFIMRNYRRGDKICLFGFSRGAHTARVVAGMLYKVGLLPAHNDQQLDFAFSIYQMTGDHGIELSREFKRTFAIPVTVEFVGVWDTVSSVGIIPRSHPYTSVNYAVKTFRHALALDERRARFRPQTWNEPTIDREQDLDVDDPKRILKPIGDKSLDDWEYQPPDRTMADVKEVWFAGAHADVGGGSHNNQEKNSLSFIPLRWMIKECLLAGTDVLFDQEALTSLGFNFEQFETSLKMSPIEQTLQQFGFTDPRKTDVQAPEVDLQKKAPPSSDSPSGSGSLSSIHSPFFASSSFGHNLYSLPSTIVLAIQTKFGHDHPLLNIAIQHAKDTTDCIADVWDQLDLHPVWWILEALPMLTTFQKADGSWVRKRMRNFGQGRYIPYCGDKVLVHKSVEERILTARNPKYKPHAFNWDIVENSGMREYVY